MPQSEGREPVRIVVADGHPVVRRGYGDLLKEQVDVQVVGECGTGEEALQTVDENSPDLVILGLNLTGEKDGIEVCRRIKASPEVPRVLICAAYNSANDVLSCLSAGADSYVHKRTSCEGLLDAIYRTASGEQVLLLGGRIGDPRSHSANVPEEADLTPRELEVLALKARRFSNAEIARALRISVNTVKHHVTGIRRKTGKTLTRILPNLSFAPDGYEAHVAPLVP